MCMNKYTCNHYFKFYLFDMKLEESRYPEASLQLHVLPFPGNPFDYCSNQSQISIETHPHTISKNIAYVDFQNKLEFETAAAQVPEREVSKVGGAIDKNSMLLIYMVILYSSLTQ